MLSHNFDLHHYVFVFSCQGKQPLLSAAGQQFSTYDRDNDKDTESNCAGLLQGVGGLIVVQGAILRLIHPLRVTLMVNTHIQSIIQVKIIAALDGIHGMGIK